VLRIIFVTNIPEGSGDCNKFNNGKIHNAFLKKKFAFDQIKEEEKNRKRGTC
jgi:hypothetical protein